MTRNAHLRDDLVAHLLWHIHGGMGALLLVLFGELGLLWARVGRVGVGRNDKIINQYQVEKNIMPYSVLSKKLDKLSNLVIDFIKQTKKINTIRRVESTFSPSILKLLLRCIFANLGITMDLCSKIQDEKIAASEPPTILDLDVVFDIVRDYKEAKNTILRDKNVLL